MFSQRNLTRFRILMKDIYKCLKYFKFRQTKQWDKQNPTENELENKDFLH